MLSSIRIISVLGWSLWYVLRLFLDQLAGQPIQALVQSLALRGTSRLDVPPSVAHVVQSQLLRQLRGRHRIRQILLVGEDQDHSVAQLVLGQHVLELLLGLTHSLPVVRVHDKDQALRVLEVVPPQRTDLVLATDIPHSERDVLVLHSLDIEADCGDRRHDLAQFQFVEDGRLTGSIQTDCKASERVSESA